MAQVNLIHPMIPQRPVRQGRPHPWRSALAWASLLLVAACQAQPPATAAIAVAAATPKAAPAALTTEADLLARIRSEIGAAACTSDSQCRSLAIGAKPCGGPEAWMAWSSANARADKLQAWAAELADLQRARNERSGIASNCQYNPDPGAVCSQQRCVLGGSNLAR